MVWKDHNGKRHKKTTGVSKKSLARDIAAAHKSKLLQEHERRIKKSFGLIDQYEEQEQTRLDILLTKYEKVLEVKQKDSEYIPQTIARCQRIIDFCRFQVVGDISREAVELALGKLRDERTKKLLSANTRNTYLASLKAYIEWLVPRYLDHSPIAKMEKLNIACDRRRIRRALTVSEFSKLVAAAKDGRQVGQMGGRERALAYICACYSGYRRGSLQSLCCSDFDLEAGTVNLPAAKAKGRKETPPTPIHPALLPTIRKALEGLEPDDRLLSNLTKHVSCRGFKLDMKAAGVPLIDKRGKIADFHGLRGTYATLLQQSGVGLSDAQKLMHHSTPKLTSNIYTDMTLDTAREAIAKLPPPPSLD